MRQVFVQLENLTLPAAIKAARDSARITPAATMAPASSVIETKPGPEDPPPADEAEAAASDGSPPTAAGDSHAVAGVAESKSSGESSPGAEDEAPTAPSASEAEAETAAEAAAASTAAAAESEAAATSQSQGLPHFVPSEDWLRQVKSELPLNTIMRLLHHLAAQVTNKENRVSVWTLQRRVAARLCRGAWLPGPCDGWVWFVKPQACATTMSRVRRAHLVKSSRSADR